MLLAGRGELYDGEDCSLCATTRGRGEQEEARGKQGDGDEGAEDPGEDGETFSCHRQESKRKKLSAGDIRRHMGSPEVRTPGIVDPSVYTATLNPSLAAAIRSLS